MNCKKTNKKLVALENAAFSAAVLLTNGLGYILLAGQVGLGVGSRLSNRAPEGSNPKGTRLYFVILLKNVEKIFDWH